MRLHLIRPTCIRLHVFKNAPVPISLRMLSIWLLVNRFFIVASVGDTLRKLQLCLPQNMGSRKQETPSKKNLINHTGIFI